MTSDDVQELRDLVSKIAHHVGQSATHKTLDDDLRRIGLPPSTSGPSKADRTESSLLALPDDQLAEVARKMVAKHEWLGSDGRRMQDLVWMGEHHPHISKRTRRDIARALGGDELIEHYSRFRALLDALFDLGGGVLWGGRDYSVGGEIDRHFHHNPDWSVEEVFDAVGAIDASSDRRFGLLIEGIVSGNTIPDEGAQRRIATSISAPIEAAGLELREIGTLDGYPAFEVVSARAHRGRPKNLIFASSTKPDLRLNDAIDNEIEILSDPDDVLVYDRPITTSGIRWRDLQAWFQDTRRLASEREAKTQLYRRLRQSLPDSSPPQRLLFDLYHEIHGTAVYELPALLPEVWLYWDPLTVKARGVAALLNLRMDFLLLVPGGGRIVLEVDGRTHYGIEKEVSPGQKVWIADPSSYARTTAGSRRLTLTGYEVYRFGAHELRNDRQARPLLAAFFSELFLRHRVKAVRQ